MEKKLKELAKFAHSIGIDHFALLMKTQTIKTFHYENIKMVDLMNLMISGFLNVIEREIEMHPEYSKERKEIYGSLANDFSMMIKDYDRRIIELMAKEKKG